MACIGSSVMKHIPHTTDNLSQINSDVLDAGQSNCIRFPESCYVIEIDVWLVCSSTVTFTSSLELRRASTCNSNTQTR